MKDASLLIWVDRYLPGSTGGLARRLFHFPSTIAAEHLDLFPRIGSVVLRPLTITASALIILEMDLGLGSNVPPRSRKPA